MELLTLKIFSLIADLVLSIIFIVLLAQFFWFDGGQYAFERLVIVGLILAQK